LAKKKQSYSTENVDEMVEKLRESYENADRAEGENIDSNADDEAFAKMLVEMFGKQSKDQPSSAKKSNELYSAEDFMPDEEDEPEEDLEESFEDETEEEFIEEIEEEVEEDIDEEFDEEIDEDIDEQIDEDVDEEYAQEDPEEITAQIRKQAETKITEQFRQENHVSESEQIPPEELPWFDEDEMDEEDAREIAEYEALVAQDELEQMLEWNDWWLKYCSIVASQFAIGDLGALLSILIFMD